MKELTTPQKRERARMALHSVLGLWVLEDLPELDMAIVSFEGHKWVAALERYSLRSREALEGRFSRGAVRAMDAATQVPRIDRSLVVLCGPLPTEKTRQAVGRFAECYFPGIRWVLTSR